MTQPNVDHGESLPKRLFGGALLQVEQAWTWLGDTHLEKPTEPWLPSQTINRKVNSVREQRARVSRGIESAMHSSAEALFAFVVGTEDRTLSRQPGTYNQKDAEVDDELWCNGGRLDEGDHYSRVDLAKDVVRNLGTSDEAWIPEHLKQRFYTWGRQAVRGALETINVLGGVPAPTDISQYGDLSRQGVNEGSANPLQTPND